ncbi:MAG: cysteine dioxygenase [Betaproteobacteria bacterium]|nr:MAG: cysteine dioxygenase [Betaproteobacteria bacterium]
MNSQRFLDFLASMDAAVAQSLTEPALLDRAEQALSALIAHDDWLPESYAKPSAEKYQQYLLYADPEGRYSVQSFVWAPGQGTPIHNHTVWGLVGVMRGAEHCSEYPMPGSAAMHCTHEHRLSRGEIDRVSPTIGDWHAVANAFDDQVSLSIHVYGADIGRIERSVFDPITQTIKPFTSGYSNDRAWITQR